MKYLDVRAWEEAGRDCEAIRARDRAVLEAQRRLHIDAAVRTAAQHITDARRDGMHSATVGTITEFERDIIDVACFDELTSGQDYSSRMLGPWAAFRDELKTRNITLSAMSHVAGTGCNSRHWAFNLVIRW